MGVSNLGVAAQGEFVRGEVDPIIHKLLHGGIGAACGGILGGKDGTISGTSAAVVAETLADIIRPQVEAALTAIAVNADSAESYHTQAEEYLNTQHNLILLTSVSITASLGGDVDTAYINDRCERNIASPLQDPIKILNLLCFTFFKRGSRKNPFKSNDPDYNSI